MGSQLGALMVRKGLNAEAVVASWDESGDGLIQVDEFRREVIKIGVVCENESEIDALFKALDTDGAQGGERRVVAQITGATGICSSTAM